VDWYCSLPENENAATYLIAYRLTVPPFSYFWMDSIACVVIEVAGPDHIQIALRVDHFSSPLFKRFDSFEMLPSETLGLMFTPILGGTALPVFLVS